MRRAIAILSAAVLLFAGLHANGAEPREEFLEELPPGVFLKSSVEASPEQTRAIGRKLGGDIEKLTNSSLLVHGRPIQINAITASDGRSAEAIHRALSRMKSYPFCMRKGRVVIEYAGRTVDAALAVKTSYELGLLDKPSMMRYGVVAELAAVDKADYMALNPLLDLFITASGGSGGGTEKEIEELRRNFTFGNFITLKNAASYGESAEYRFQPDASDSAVSGTGVSYSFENLPTRHGIPFVTVSMEIGVDDTGIRKGGGEIKEELLAPTPFWPSGDPEIVSLARRITGDRGGIEAKVNAILEWLTPGRNIEFSGQTGSRRGTLRVLDQKYGRCWDFSDCFVTLARACGIPARQVAGWLYGSGGHVWAEVYIEGKGWRQVDPTGGGRLQCGIYHIPYFSSDDGRMPILYLSMPVIEVIRAD
jgi:hypothetical protein